LQAEHDKETRKLKCENDQLKERLKASENMNKSLKKRLDFFRAQA